MANTRCYGEIQQPGRWMDMGSWGRQGKPPKRENQTEFWESGERISLVKKAMWKEDFMQFNISEELNGRNENMGR